MPLITNLAPHRRGDTFIYTGTLGGGWQFSDFTGGMLFTLRTSPASSDVLDDTGAIYQASTAGGQIVGGGTSVTITIADSETVGWPAKRIWWDLQGIVTSPRRVVTIDAGQVLIAADITRSQT